MNMDQNDIYGNWESGLNFNKYENAPSHLKDNKASRTTTISAFNYWFNWCILSF